MLAEESSEPNLLAVCKNRSKLLQPSDHDAAQSERVLAALRTLANQ
jgi:hypothetical protein